jgi:hypothetical protein
MALDGVKGDWKDLFRICEPDEELNKEGRRNRKVKEPSCLLHQLPM